MAIFLLTFFLQSVYAKQLDAVWIPKADHSRQYIELTSYKGAQVSKSCAPKFECLAAKAKDVTTVTGKPAIGPLGKVINPESTRCHQANGKSLIASDNNSNQFNVCLFDDGSLILSSALLTP